MDPKWKRKEGLYRELLWDGIAMARTRAYEVGGGKSLSCLANEWNPTLDEAEEEGFQAGAITGLCFTSEGEGAGLCFTSHGVGEIDIEKQQR